MCVCVYIKYAPTNKMVLDAERDRAREFPQLWTQIGSIFEVSGVERSAVSIVTRRLESFEDLLMVT